MEDGEKCFVARCTSSGTSSREVSQKNNNNSSTASNGVVASHNNHFVRSKETGSSARPLVTTKVIKSAVTGTSGKQRQRKPDISKPTVSLSVSSKTKLTNGTGAASYSTSTIRGIEMKRITKVRSLNKKGDDTKPVISKHNFRSCCLSKS
jgi:hypothetical protein